MSSRRRFIGFAGAAALSAAHPFAHAAAHAQAADYPARPVRLVVPFAAGGGPDVQARELAARLAVALGRKATLVVENIVGAGGILAAQNAARLSPDGHDLLLGASSHVVQKAMQPSVRFDPLTDFVHISRTATSPSVLVVGTSSPYRTLDELLTAAQAAPGRLNYASGGVGSAAHLCAAALCVQAAIEAQHIPYKGSVEIVPSIVAGDTHFAFPIASTAIPQMRAGRVRALAVTSAQRMSMLPEVPTLAELRNSQDLVLDAWFGLWAPAGTPTGVVDILFEAVAQTCKDTALRARTEAAGSLLAPSTSPAEFKRFIETESAKFARLVKAARLSVSS